MCGSAAMGPSSSGHFDVDSFLAKKPQGLMRVRHAKNWNIFLQGDEADAMFVIRKGRVKLTVVSSTGKRAIVALLKEGDFAGEECMLGHGVRLTTATATTDCELVKIQKEAVRRLLRKEAEFGQFFAEGLVSREISSQQDLIDRLFNPVEKRLARALLLLAQLGRERRNETVRLKVSQETLAEMIGSNRPRVNEFMNKFKRLGFIDYNNEGLEIHMSLLNRVLRE
jgi:CRP/FNR family cyclic AMP-dependent transcriptional regulator